MDIIGRFVGECTVLNAGATAVGKFLYGSYVAWCKRNGEYAVKARKFYSEVRKKYPNLKERHGEAGLVFEGMGLKAGDHYPTPEDVW
jgi:phage/plasmid-associated DNA primase